MSALDYRTYWEKAIPWERYLNDEVQRHRALWEGVYRKSEVPPWAMDAAQELNGDTRLLVLTEDWCGDAANTVPVLARFAEVAPTVMLRVLKRDENLELMDRHLTAGSRSIPLAVVLNVDFVPVGQWGPRPRELQELVLREKRACVRPSDEIYRDVRTWYARDRGATTLRELLAIMNEAEASLRTAK